MSIFFQDWHGLLRVLIVGVAAYVALVVLVRVSGKRTLSKLNAFDLVVTVALGSTLATVLLSSTVALAEGVLAMAVPVGLQFAVTWTSVRWRWARSVVRSEPTLLLHNGTVLKDACRRARVTQPELEQIARTGGFTTLEKIGAVVQETDGSFSVLSQAQGAAVPPAS